MAWDALRYLGAETPPEATADNLNALDAKCWAELEESRFRLLAAALKESGA